MASELEGLIAGLLVHISCQGEKGCPVADVLKSIRHPTTHSESPLSEGNSAVQDRTAASIWSWLVARRDISVGVDREYNDLTLNEVLALSDSGDAPKLDAETSEPQPDDPAEAQHVRVYASEDTMWESLTGHAVDYKRVPKSEWMLLLGIASTTTQGILQGDLGRLMGQDKRSVPKRTDSLLKKGYIVKRTTLVRGTKTSKMWLKIFAPPLPKDGEGADEVRPDMTLTRQILIDDLEPVPWCIRWIGESIDYIALATTIMAIVKEWGVLQMKDMKSKLGVLGMRWQMKVLAKVCRFLNQRGVIQYVAAKLGEKVFKDCVKYVRDLDPEDWALYLSTGKRKSKTVRHSDLDGSDGNKQLIGQASNVSEITKAPPWSLDKPVPVIIAEMAKRLGDAGLTNPDVYALTLGPSYSRYLSSMTTALSVTNLQPPHLAHFQIYSEHTRSGKVASYRYFAPNDTPSAPPLSTDPANHPQTIADTYGFSSVPSATISPQESPSLIDLCNMGMVGRKSKGRPTKPKAKKQGPTATPKAKTARKRRSGVIEIPPQDAVVVVVDSSAPAEEPVDSQVQEAVIEEPKQDEVTQAQPEIAQTEPEVTQEETENTNGDDAVSEPQTAGKLIVTLKVSPDALKKCLAISLEIVATPARQTRARPTRSSAKKDETRIESTNADNDESQVQEVDEEALGDDASTNTPLTGRKRGRPKKGEPRRKRNAEKASANETPSRPWACEKCGRVWKNDNGLLYHITKSRTACNPSFDESTITPARHGKKRAASEMDDEDITTPSVEKPHDEDQGNVEEEFREEPKDQEKDEGRELTAEHEEAPTPKRVSKLRGPVAGRPSWAARPTVSFRGDAFQVNPELQRPPVAMFGSSTQPSLLNATNGALVQGENGHLRPVLGSLNRFPLSAGSPKTPRPKYQRNGSQPTTAHQPEQPGSVQHDADETPSKVGSVVNAKTSATIDEPPSKTAINNRVSQIIMGILGEQQGVFPADKPLWTAITARWTENFPEAVPQIRSYQAAFREMLKNKSVAEHWFTFRSSKGVTEKCHIAVLAGVDPFSPEATEVVQKIQEVHPDPYLPPPFDAQVGQDLLKRGRRDLPEEVELLDAPVYVARAAQKRAHNEHEDDRDDFPPPAKRGRKRKSLIVRGRLSRGGARQGSMGESLRYKPFESSHDAFEALEFLEPNTMLGRKGNDVSKDCFTDGFTTASNDISGDIIFDKPIIVSGYDGIWPYISPSDFEMQDGSYTLRGWQPDKNWFAWSSMIEMIDRKAHALNRQKFLRQGKIDPYESFVGKLYCCVDLERAWSEAFIHAPQGAAGPHNIFVSFSSTVGNDSVETSALSWPLEWQLAPKSFPGDVPDRALLVDSSSDEESDSDEWPRFSSSVPNSGSGNARPRSNLPRSSTSKQHTSSRQSPGPSSQMEPEPLPKTRRLLPIPAARRLPGQDDHLIADPDQEERLLAAFVAVRVLLGGVELSIDWGMLLELFPNFGLYAIRKFWARIRQSAHLKKLTKDFQDQVVIAFEKDELLIPDFDAPLDYDWHSLIDWTLRLPRRRGIDLPSTREAFEAMFTLTSVATHDEDDARKIFYNPQSSVSSRLNAVSTSAVVTVDKMLSGGARVRGGEHVEITQDVIARSWVKSLCYTDPKHCTVEQMQHKFAMIAGGDKDAANETLKKAIDALKKDGIIAKSEKFSLSTQNYYFKKVWHNALEKHAQRTKYQQAADFKTKLDEIFRRGDSYQIPSNPNDGSVMAILGLNASERIELCPTNVPHIPLGFVPLQYESRKLDKSVFHFDLVIVPTESYKYNEDIDVLQRSVNEGPPTAGKDKGNSVLPHWVDIFGRREAERWMDVLGAFCFVFATRGYVTIEGVCNALYPVLEKFEAKMIMDWGLKTGVLEESELGVKVGEWWWLAVPWQWGRQFQLRGRRQSPD
ncbi:Ff.00g127310.m01.CDS01 [Fusarium sp. VM40]|nr:Ff.00g127310.m01.CDS01 [Fusarium sp. VM40]